MQFFFPSSLSPPPPRLSCVVSLSLPSIHMSQLLKNKNIICSNAQTTKILHAMKIMLETTYTTSSLTWRSRKGKFWVSNRGVIKYWFLLGWASELFQSNKLTLVVELPCVQHVNFYTQCVEAPDLGTVIDCDRATAEFFWSHAAASFNDRKRWQVMSNNLCLVFVHTIGKLHLSIIHTRENISSYNGTCLV